MSQSLKIVVIDALLRAQARSTVDQNPINMTSVREAMMLTPSECVDLAMTNGYVRAVIKEIVTSDQSPHDQTATDWLLKMIHTAEVQERIITGTASLLEKIFTK